MSGWFAMNRAMFTHPIFAGKPERIAAWAWILASAAWKDTRQDANGTSVLVRRGQLLTSYRQMSDATGVGIKTLRNLISRLSTENALGIDTGTGRLLLTIRNYDKYQSPVKEGGTGEGTGGAQEGHTKEQGNKETIPPSEEATASQPVSVSVVTTALWNAGKQYLSSHEVKNPGGVIGRWLKSSDALSILNAIEAAQRAGTQDPIPYITQILNGGDGYDNRTGTPKFSDRRENRTDPALEQIARLAGLGEAPRDAGGGAGGYGEENGPLRLGAGSRFGGA